MGNIEKTMMALCEDDPIYATVLLYYGEEAAYGELKSTTNELYCVNGVCIRTLEISSIVVYEDSVTINLAHGVNP